MNDGRGLMRHRPEAARANAGGHSEYGGQERNLRSRARKRFPQVFPRKHSLEASASGARMD